MHHRPRGAQRRERRRSSGRRASRPPPSLRPVGPSSRAATCWRSRRVGSIGFCGGSMTDPTTTAPAVPGRSRRSSWRCSTTSAAGVFNARSAAQCVTEPKHAPAPDDAPARDVPVDSDPARGRAGDRRRGDGGPGQRPQPRPHPSRPVDGAERALPPWSAWSTATWPARQGAPESDVDLAFIRGRA